MLSTKLKEAAGNSADATLYVDDVFSTYLYTGNGSTQTITNGIDLTGKGGMVWLKSRSSTTNYHILTDTVRGAGLNLSSNATIAQFNDGQPTFNSNGFNLINNNPDYNASTATYASWTFRKAAKFFDVVTYYGNGIAGRSIAHSLGVAPGMIIVKNMEYPYNWAVYHRSVGQDNCLYLNLTDAQIANNRWNNTAPTQTAFTVSGAGEVNGSSQNYVAYLFAHDTDADGIIQCGSFTTDGSGNATVNLGWEPQYLLAKTSGVADDWYVVDSMRGFTQSASDAILRPNTAGAETNYNFGYERPTATGFEFKGMGATRTYIYMAIRRPNKPPTTGTQVFSLGLYSGTNTGAGQTQIITTSVNAPDIVSTQSRNNTYGTYWTPRLTEKALSTQYTSGESDYADLQDFLQQNQFRVNGFPVVNASGTNFIWYAICRAPGFFDEVCYTGTGSATIQAHNLTVAPELMIVKRRNDAGAWGVYTVATGNSSLLELQSTGAVQTGAPQWNSTTPTSSVFSLGVSSTTNASGSTYVAYLFATLAGISKVGSYAGNGTGQAIACGFSAGARFVLIKRTDSTGDWYTFDSARGLTSGSSPYLLLNSTAAEVTGNNGVYASTGGFTLGSTASTTTNINAATYIFLAVA